MNIYVDAIIAAHPGAHRALVEDAFKKLDRLGYNVIAAFDRVNEWAAAGRFEYEHKAPHADPTGNEVVSRVGKSKWWRLEHMPGFMAPSPVIRYERKETV